MVNQKQKLGRWGEEQAANYLMDQGYEILERNARTAYGEIDLVARQLFEYPNKTIRNGYDNEPVIVFVEVKARTSRTFGYPEQAVDSRKQAHMLAAASAYLQNHPELIEDWRLDVIAIQRFRDGRPPEIIHFENVITEY